MKNRIKEMLNSSDEEIRLLGLSYLNQDKIYSHKKISISFYGTNSEHSVHAITHLITCGLLHTEINIDNYIDYCYDS